MTKNEMNTRENVACEIPRIRDRTTAGRLLAEEIQEWMGRDRALVLGIPRGGVPVAVGLASALRLPLDIIVVQRIRLPLHDVWQQDMDAGAISMGGIQFLYTGLIAAQQPLPEDVALAIETARTELAHREAAYRDACPAPELKGRPIIMVDDGMVTGSTMRVAIAAARLQKPESIIVAVPFATRTSLQEIRSIVDEVVCLSTLPASAPVHSYYDEPQHIAEEDVRTIIEAGRQQQRMI